MVDAVVGTNDVNNHQRVYGGFKDMTGGDQSNCSVISRLLGLSA